MPTRVACFESRSCMPLTVSTPVIVPWESTGTRR